MVRSLSVMLAALAAESTAARAAEPWVPPAGFETFETAQALGLSPAEKEQAKAPGKRLAWRAVILAGGATLGSDPAEDAFRNRFDLDRHAPLLLSHWLRYGPNGSRQAIGQAYCAVRLKLLVGQLVDCFRDTDGDGRLDSALSYAPARRAGAKLEFSPIAPVPFTAWKAPDGPSKAVRAAEGDVRIEYEHDSASGRLVFYLRSVQSFGRAEERLEPSLAVDPATLPATISFAGSTLRLVAWDGKRLTLSVDAATAPTPVRVDPPPTGYGRKKGGYRLVTADGASR
jgi:hypothetical protein